MESLTRVQRLRRASLVGLAALASMVPANTARATYSIAVIDSETQLVGGAGVSCVGNISVQVIHAAVPGVGVLHAQALLSEATRDEAEAMMAMGASASEILAKLTDPTFDPAFDQRQYAILVLPEDGRLFTGADTLPVAAHEAGVLDSYRFTAQGNILTSTEVISGAIAGFETPTACDMAERLILALEAGAANGEGDSRCTPNGIPADSGFMRIVDAQGEVLLELDVVDTAPDDPVVLLRQAFDAWRATHPCPEPDPDPDPDPDDSGESEDGGDESGAATTGSSTESGSEAPSADPSAVDESGCACAASSTHELALGFEALLAALILLGHRRRRARRMGAWT